MLKVLIVDDELIVRVGLNACLDWEKLGYEVVAMAEDGKEAFHIIEEVCPDIVFTDIKMPEMDGLELIRAVRKSHPQIKFIVLSCLNEIDYVKQAMKLGAEDYILKLTFQPEDLAELLVKLKEEIEQEPERRINAEAAEDGHFEREQIYRKLLFDTALFPKQEEELFKRLNLPDLQDHYFHACCITIDKKEGRLPVEKMRDAYLLKFAVINILKEFLDQYPFTEVVEVKEGEYLAYFCSQEKTVLQDLYSSFKWLNNALKTHLNFTVSLGLGSASDRCTDLRRQYQEAGQALKHRFFVGDECFSDYQPEKGYAQQPERSLEQPLLSAVVNYNKVDAEAALDKWVRKTKEHPASPSAVRAYAVEMRASLCRLARELELEIPDCQASSDALLSAETLDEVSEMLKGLSFSILNSLETERGIRKEIIKVKQYIASHLEEPLHLEEAAELCGISKAYFSTLFKKECRESYSNYVNRMKMEKARDLIQLKHLKASEAAAMVGILDDSYFSKLFRKYIGVNPSQIKEKQERPG